jgi:hypothetical protein
MRPSHLTLFLASGASLDESYCFGRVPAQADPRLDELVSKTSVGGFNLPCNELTEGVLDNLRGRCPKVSETEGIQVNAEIGRKPYKQRLVAFRSHGRLGQVFPSAAVDIT